MNEFVTRPQKLADNDELRSIVNWQAARIVALEQRFDDVIANLEDLRKRPDDMMILGTALSIAKNYKKVQS